MKDITVSRQSWVKSESREEFGIALSRDARLIEFIGEAQQPVPEEQRLHATRRPRRVTRLFCLFTRPRYRRVIDASWTI